MSPSKTKKKRKKVKRVHCSKCGKISPTSATTFPLRMAWLRRHRKRKHPKAHKKSVRKTMKTKKNPSGIVHRIKAFYKPDVEAFTKRKGTEHIPEYLKQKGEALR